MGRIDSIGWVMADTIAGIKTRQITPHDNILFATLRRNKDIEERTKLFKKEMVYPGLEPDELNRSRMRYQKDIKRIINKHIKEVR